MRVQLAKITQKLEERKARGLFRTLTVPSGLVDFSSNDYLGFVRRLPRVSHSLGGSGGSRLLCGHSSQAAEAECKLADYFRGEACLIFPSGYQANLALLSSLPQRDDTILVDQLIHASIKDGFRLQPGARHTTFKHNDLQDLEGKLNKLEGNKWVVVESVYSMDGDRAPLASLARLCEKYEAALIVDEAHSSGLWGPNGAGICVAEGLEDKVLGRVYTFGKAFGYHGACVVGPRSVIDYLINFARPFIYSTAPPPDFYRGLLSCVELRKACPPVFTELLKNIAYFQQACRASLPKLPVTDTPIQVFPVAGNQEAATMAAQLRTSGFDLRPILSPTVAKGSERLRICLHAFNTRHEIFNLVNSIAQLVK